MDPITLYIVQALIGVAISAGVSLIQQALTPKPDATKTTRGFRGQFTFGGTVPLKIVLGTYGVPGHLEYRNTWGNSGGTPNSQVTDVLSLSDYVITDVTASWVDTQSITLPGTDLTTPGYPVPEYEDGGKDHLWYRFLDGTQTTVSSFLTGKFGADAVRPWETDMVGEGIAQAFMSARVNDKLWTGFPTYMFELQGAPVFDPRESTAAGGSGSQVWGTLSTYEFSDNPIVLIYNILRGIYDGDDNHIWGGRATAYQLPYDVWEAAMDRCDTLVNKKGGGTEKRYRAGIEIGVNERPTDIIRELLIGCNGRIAYHQGQYFPLVDVPSEADGSFADTDMLADQPHTASLFPDLDSIVNGAAATYIERQRAWESKETAPYYRADLEAEDDDRRLLESLTLRTVFSGTQAQRILKAVVEESRRFKRHIVALPPGFGVYRPLQVLAWTSDEFQYDEKLFLITSKTEDEWGNILLALQELDPSDFDWDEEADEQEIDFAPITPIIPPTQAVAGWAVEPYNDGKQPGIHLEWTGALEDIGWMQVLIRLAGEVLPFFDREYPYDEEHDTQDIYILGNPLLPDTEYEVSARFIPKARGSRPTTWTTWYAVTTDPIDINNVLDVYEGSIIADLPDSVRDWQTWAGMGVRELIDALGEIARRAAEQDLANYNDVQTLNRRLVSTFESSRAEFNEAIVAATGPDSAIVLQLTELQAQVDDDIATAVSGLLTQIGEVDGELQTLAEAFTSLTAASENGDITTTNWRMQAVPGPSGYSRIGAQTRVGGEGDWRGASWFLDTPANPALPTRFVVTAQQFVITDSSTLFTPFVFEAGVAKMMAARINVITAGKLQNSTGSSYFDLTNNKLRIST